MNVHTMMGRSLAALAVLGLVACGGGTKSTKSDDSSTSATRTTPAKRTAAKRAEAAPAAGTPAAKESSSSKLTEDDFKVRETTEVKAPVFLPDVKKEAQDEFREGVKAALASPPRYSEAARQFRSAISIDSRFMEAYFNLGQTLERMNKREEALGVYKNAMEANPDDPSAGAYVAKLYLGKARTEELLGNPGEARGWLDQAKSILDGLLAKAPGNTAVNNAMALYYLAMGDSETAERFVKEVLYADPTNVTALNTRGLLNLKAGKYLIAEWIFLRKVLEQDKNSTEALTNLGFTYIMLGKRPLAMKYFKQALEQDESNMEVRMNIASMLLEHLNYAEAHEHYKLVLEKQPLNVEAREGLCDATFGLGGEATDKKAQFKEAIDCYLDLVGRRSDRVSLYKRIAETYQQKLEDLENAVKYYELYAQRGNLDAKEKDQVVKTVFVLKDIISKGGLKAMMAPPEDGGFDDDGGFDNDGGDAGEGAGDGGDAGGDDSGAGDAGDGTSTETGEGGDG